MRLVFILFIFLITPPTEAILRLKFQHWFPQYESHWMERAGACHQEVSDYLNNNRKSQCRSPCSCAADCLLQDLHPTIQSNLASAQVLLGFAPAILLYFGPTIAEVAALSTYRPLLAVLLSLGSPGVSFDGLFRHVDLREPFVQPLSRSAHLWSRWLSRQSVGIRNAIRVLSYVFTLAALANNVQNSVYTDLRTISGWRCSAILLPLAWSLLAVVVHTWGMVAIRMRLRAGYRPSIKSAVRSVTFLEVLKCADNIWSETLLWLATLSAIIHMVFGVLVLSSLIFISASEALRMFVLYAASALLCRTVLLMESSMMRYEISKNKAAESSTGHVEIRQSGLSRAHTV